MTKKVILHVLRYQSKGNYSIENVFNTVRKELGDDFYFRSLQPNKVFDVSAYFKLLKEQSNTDLIHFTGASNYLAVFPTYNRSILTIHDIGHFTNSLSGFKKYVYGKLWFQYPTTNVDLITTVSSFTAGQINRYFNVPFKKIVVVKNPVNPVFRESLESFEQSKFKILQIGGGAHKNLTKLLTAVSGLDITLILVRSYDASLDKKLKGSNIDVEWYSDIPQQELASLYRTANALFFASTYEGFGLPIIEAQASGVPVITSNFAPMDEVAGPNGALFVDPLDTLDIRKALLKLMHDEDERCELISAGRQNVKRYTP